MNGAAWGAVFILLGAACWTDLRRMRIPNGLTIPFAAGGLLYHGLGFGTRGLSEAVMGAAAGAIPLLLLYALKGMGGGDVKWFGAFGTWASAALTLQLMVLSIFYAGAIALLLLSFRWPIVSRLAVRVRWPWGEHPSQAEKGAKFPFMLAVAPGFATLCWMNLF
jgi:prepilin peptidase CpaA